MSHAMRYLAMAASVLAVDHDDKSFFPFLNQDLGLRVCLYFLGLMMVV